MMEGKRLGVSGTAPLDEFGSGFLALEFARVQNSFTHLTVEEERKNLRRWLGALKDWKPHNIPAPTVIIDGNLRLSQLDKTDPRGLFSGVYSDCCMHPQGYAAACAWHGHRSPDGAFWVVERYGNIIAAAWVWKHEDNLVIDSVEAIDDEMLPRIHLMYIKAASSVLSEKINRVYAGCGFNGLWAEDGYIIRPFPSPAPYRYKGETYDDSFYAHIIADRWE